MEAKKTQLNCWVDPHVKAALERVALKEGRRTGNLGGRLLEWAYRQLQIAGNSIALLDLDISPSLGEAVQRQAKMEKEIYEQQGHTVKPRRVKAS